MCLVAQCSVCVFAPRICSLVPSWAGRGFRLFEGRRLLDELPLPPRSARGACTSFTWPLVAFFAFLATLLFLYFDASEYTVFSRSLGRLCIYEHMN